MNVTYHAGFERADRIVYIAQKIGWGEIVLETYREEYSSRCCLTSTGVVLVKAKDSDTLITAYIATKKQVYAMYRCCGFSHVPSYLENRVRKNQQLKHQLAGRSSSRQLTAYI